MPMSWECTEGPYGKYPGEDGYEEDLERYDLHQFEIELNRHDYDEELPWYTKAYYNFLLTSDAEQEYVVPPNNEYMREQFINYLFNKDNVPYITLKRDTKVYLHYEAFADGIDIRQIDDFTREIHSICVSNPFILLRCQMLDKVVLDIYNDANDKIVEKVTELLREKSNNILFLKNE